MKNQCTLDEFTRKEKLKSCNPLGMIIEQAGGLSVDSHLQRTLEKEPFELHQRSTIALGSPGMVEEFVGFVKKYSALAV